MAVPVLAFFVSIMDYASFSWARDRLQIIPMMWDQKENYAFNGFTLAFALNLPMANVAAPAGYSADAISDIPRAAGRRRVPADKPDIIIVMSESFWDPTRLPGVTHHARSDRRPCARCARATMFSPEFGGMTANVEFEALTGFSNAFLPYGSIPYQQYVRRPLPSLATFLRGEGYVTRALHPFAAMVLEPRAPSTRLSASTLPVGGADAAAEKARPACLGCRLHRGDHPPGRH